MLYGLINHVLTVFDFQFTGPIDSINGRFTFPSTMYDDLVLFKVRHYGPSTRDISSAGINPRYKLCKDL